MLAVGVDGCRKGWIAVALQDGRFAGASRFASFSEVVDHVVDAVAIAVDMPIGLVAHGERSCDGAVRQFVGPRRASVFSIPPRAALEAPSHAEADDLCRQLMGKGLSKQSYGLRDKILQLDAVVRREQPATAKRKRYSSLPPPSSRASVLPGSLGASGIQGSDSGLAKKLDTPSGLRRYARVIERDGGKAAVLRAQLRSSQPAGRIVEAHPEASFRQMLGKPLEYSKKTYNGMMLRLRLLGSVGIELPGELGVEIGKVSVDDVLDAAAVAWTADRYARTEAESFPGAENWQLDGTRIIAIWV